jgi:hypothetical protein
MRIPLGAVLAVAGVAIVPAAARAQAHHAAATQHPAQHEMKHELGVDLILGYSMPQNQPSGFGALTPVDVRIGFVSHSSMSFEGRLNLDLLSGFGGGTTYSIDPGVNVLFRLGQGTITHNKYFTAGADVDIQDNGANSGAVFGLNGGIGMRKPYGPGAWRFEAFGDYKLKNTNLGEPGTFTLGLRAGLSLWH